MMAAETLVVGTMGSHPTVARTAVEAETEVGEEVVG